MRLNIDALSVEGYLFYTEKDAKLAKTERQKIEYLEARIDYSNPESIKYVYEKTVHERIFKTPIGIQYLQHLRTFLLEQPEIDPEQVIDIPLYVVFDGESGEQSRSGGEAGGTSQKEKKEKSREKSRFTASVIINVVLALAIIVMFYISFKSDQPNIFNYERTITNKYAFWEQELSEREQVIREKEKELRIGD